MHLYPAHPYCNIICDKILEKERKKPPEGGLFYKGISG